VVQEMLDHCVMRLSGTGEVIEAWKAILPGLELTDVIGIKVNAGNSATPVRPEVVQCITERLLQIDIDGKPFPPGNIIIWDKYSGRLDAAGYTIQIGDGDIRCFGTDYPGVGYDWEMPLDLEGITSYPSRIISQFCTRNINVCVLKDHGIAKVTLSMKNHYGSINNPWDLHGGACSPYIAVLNNQPIIRDKDTLFICDGLFGIYNGGPGGQPQSWQTFPEGTPNTLMVSKDPVSLEYEGLKVINKERESRGMEARNPVYLSRAIMLGLGQKTLTQGRRNVEKITRLHKEGSITLKKVLALIRGYLR
jgi:hypothetical protein